MIFFSFLIFPALLKSQDYVHPQKTDDGYIGESTYFMFYNHFWLNMNHYLFGTAMREDETSLEKLVDAKIVNRLSSDEKAEVEKMLDFYRKNMVHEDLRTGDYQYAFKRWVVQHSAKKPLPSFDQSPEHISLLNQFAPLFRKKFWKELKKANKRVYKSNIKLVKKLEGEAVSRLVHLSQTEWQKEKIRVDLSYLSKRGRPYTTTRPTTHILMETELNHKPVGNWFELLFHEASHHIIYPSRNFVGEIILTVAKELNIEPRYVRELWHIYLFYFTGRVSEALLEKELGIDYELYMVRNQVYNRSYPKVDKFMPAYLEGKESLVEVTKKILRK